MDAIVITNPYVLIMAIAWAIIVFNFDKILKIKTQKINIALAFLLLIYFVSFTPLWGGFIINTEWTKAVLYLTWAMLAFSVYREQQRVSKEFLQFDLKTLQKKIGSYGLFYYPSYWNVITGYFFFILLNAHGLGLLNPQSKLDTGTNTFRFNFEPIGFFLWLIYSVNVVELTWSWRKRLKVDLLVTESK